jgi:hypothetical protein
MSDRSDFLDAEEDRHYPTRFGECASCHRRTLVAQCIIQPTGREFWAECCLPCITFMRLWRVCMSWWWS